MISSTQPEVFALGEALIDLVPSETHPDRFVATPGGAPANVAAGLARLGHRSALVARVGADRFGERVASALGDAGVDLTHVVVDLVRPTPIAVVQPGAAEAERFVLYRAGAADGALDEGDLPLEAIEGCRVLHVGALSMESSRSRAATLAALAAARRGRALASVDLNLRPPAWSNAADMMAAARELIGRADLVKLNHEELDLIGESAKTILAAGPALVAVTAGQRGATITWRGSGGQERAHRAAGSVEVVDSSGAGDAFTAGLLHGFMAARPGQPELAPAALPREAVEAALEIAVAAGSAAVGRMGAMEGLAALEALPTPPSERSERQ